MSNALTPGEKVSLCERVFDTEWPRSNTPETITLKWHEYKALLNDHHFLLALFNAGVEDWEGYPIVKEKYDHG